MRFFDSYKIGRNLEKKTNELINELKDMVSVFHSLAELEDDIKNSSSKAIEEYKEEVEVLKTHHNTYLAHSYKYLEHIDIMQKNLKQYSTVFDMLYSNSITDLKTKLKKEIENTEKKLEVDYVYFQNLFNKKGFITK